MTDQKHAKEQPCAQAAPVSSHEPAGIMAAMPPDSEGDGAACCGSPPAAPSSPDQRSGYAICAFVEEFMTTTAGRVPRVKTSLGFGDWVGTVKTRMGIGRNCYMIAPGVYAIGRPDPESPVLVTANYKLTFDTLRRNLAALDLWVLVLDTRGINVWCAAGKKTFSTAEVVQRVRQCRLERMVNHNTLVLPQLSATGVAARQVKKECGFKVIWGPIRAADIRKFLENDMQADGPMRRVTFSLGERVALIPVEVRLLLKPSRWVLLAIFVLSGIGQHLFSPGDAWFRGLSALIAYAGGILAGMVAVPALLPWIPGRAFAIKGAIAGLPAALAVVLLVWNRVSGLEAAALALFTMATASFLAMNFTGSTPFTSPTGVEKEMRRAIPLQAGVTLVAALAWAWAAFIR